MEFSREEYCSGYPLLSPGDLPDPGIEPRSPVLQADSLPSRPPVSSKLEMGVDLKQTNCELLLQAEEKRLYSESAENCSLGSATVASPCVAREGEWFISEEKKDCEKVHGFSLANSLPGKTIIAESESSLFWSPDSDASVD